MKKEQLTAFLEYSEDRFTKRNVYKEDGMHAFILNFRPGQELPSHTHPGASAYLHVLKGKGTFAVNRKEIRAEENDIVFANSTDEIGFVNDSTENASLYVILSRKGKDRKSSISYNLIDYKTFSS